MLPFRFALPVQFTYASEGVGERWGHVLLAGSYGVIMGFVLCFMIHCMLRIPDKHVQDPGEDRQN